MMLRKRKQMRIVAALGPDGGLLSWSSSPTVMWLASVLVGVEYPLSE